MTEGGHEIVVNLKARTCACKKWQLTGIPCHHACACIFFQKQQPQDYLHHYYERQRFIDLYSNLLEPINGEEFWEATNQQPILPPPVRVAPGTPKIKRDKNNDVVESRTDNPTVLKRVGTTLACKYCKESGHNSRSCKSKVKILVSLFSSSCCLCVLPDACSVICDVLFTEN